MLSVSEVQCKPVKCSTSDPNASQAVQEYCVGDCVECCTEVEEDEITISPESAAQRRLLVIWMRMRPVVDKWY